MNHPPPAKVVDIRESAQRYRDFAEAGSDWLWEMDGGCRFSYFSDSFSEITGLPAETLLGKTWEESGLTGLDPGAWQRHLEAIAARRSFRDFRHRRAGAAADGQPILLAFDGKAVFDADGVFVCYRGTGNEIGARAERTELDDPASMIRSYRVARDDSGGEPSDDALRRSEALFRRAMQTARMGAFVWDDKTDECVFCSEELALLYGQSVDQYMATRGSGSGITDRIHPEDRQHYIDANAAAVAAGNRLSVEFRERVADGSYHHFREIGEPIYDDAGAYRISVGIVHDITGEKDVERALRLSEADQKRAQEQAHIGSWRWDVVAKKLIACSDEYAAIHGVEIGDVVALLDDHIEQVVHPDDRERVAAEFERTDANGACYQVEYRIVRPDGEVRHVLEIGEAYAEKGGRPVEQIGTLQDITERKRAEEELHRYRDQLEQLVAERTAQLQESERRYRTIFDSAGVGIGRSTMANGTVLFCNLWLARMLGYDTVEACVAEFVFSEHYVDPSDRARLFESYEASPGEPTECSFTKRDGAIIVLQAHAIVNHEHGFLDFVVTDITERKRIEEALRESEARFRAFIENSPAAIVIKDTDGGLLVTNKRWHDWFDPGGGEIAGKTVFDFFAEPFAREVTKLDRQIVEDGVTAEFEMETPFADGTHQTTLLQKFPILDAEGTIIAIGGINTDITERKSMEGRLRQAQKMEAVGQLTGGVAHDFNNLLAVIQGNAELLAETGESDNPFTTAILRASARGAELTHRLLAFSRRQTLRPQATDLADLVGGMTGLLERTLGEIIEIETVTSGELAPVMADPGQVENALLNLAINARDAMPDGGKLTVEHQNAHLSEAYVERNPEAVAGDYVVLAVSDNGCGMSAEVQAQAFEPFFTTKEVGKGSGLGLSMVYGFAKQSGGHVTIDSEEGRGTTVKLYLPPAEGSCQPAPEKASAAVPPGQGEVILVIEDDDDVRSLAETMLATMGYRVLATADVARARAILERGESVDLVLSDVVLPGATSGPEFAAELRQAYPTLPIVFMSGYPAEAARRGGLLGADKVLLNKPFRMDQLAIALRVALDTNQA